MFTGKCHLMGPNQSLIPLNDPGYQGKQTPLEDLALASVCVTIGLVGLVLNTLSLVVFCRVFTKACNRNHFHLFFVLLSVCEIAFCLGSVLTYTVNILSTMGIYQWEGADPATGAPMNGTFSYSVHLATAQHPVGVAAFVVFLNLSNYLPVLSQFSRNTWVSITALLRCYVATRRTNVQVSRIFSTRKVLLIFAANILFIMTLALMRTYLRDQENFLQMSYHVCETGNWSADGTVLVHMAREVPPYWSKVNMVWNMLSQFIPLLVIITSSVVLVFSLRSRVGVGSGGAERNKRVTRMVFIFALTFALLEGPRAAVFFIRDLASKTTKTLLERSPLLQRLPQATFMLSQADSIVNVFIYFFNDQHFRKELCGEAKTATGAGERPTQQQQQRQRRQHANNCQPSAPLNSATVCDVCDDAEMLPMRGADMDDEE